MKLTDFENVKFGTSGVRALVSDLTAEVVDAYAQAFLATAGKGAQEIVIGHDLRPSSPKITSVIIGALEEAGVDALYCGVLPTPALAYYAQEKDLPAIVVTGSHIPFDRNGIKFYRVEGEISKADEESMNAVLLKRRAPIAANLPAPKADAATLYKNRYLDAFGKDALLGMNIGFYQHSSAGRDILTEILEALGANVTPLERSESFVPIDTEAIRPEDVEKATQWTASAAFDAIISTDGDADRPLIADEKGQFLRGDNLGILTSRELGIETVVTPVSSTTAIEKSGWFKNVIRTKIGSPYVIAGMEEAEGVVGGFEANGGYLLGSEARKLKPLATRDSALPIIALLVSAKSRNLKLSELSKTLPARFTASDRLQEFPQDNSRALLETLARSDRSALVVLAPNAGAPTQIDQTDGMRVTFENGDIVHLRPSGNAPELRCYAESDDENRAKSLVETNLARIKADLGA